jgi:hypothetical protein
MDDTNELCSLLYVALATAAGGRELLDQSNDILRTAVDTGRVSRPDTRRTIKTLLALCEASGNPA